MFNANFNSISVISWREQNLQINYNEPEQEGLVLDLMADVLLSADC